MTGRVIILQARAEALPLPDASVDAVVCDPPYALTDLPVAAVTDALSAWLAGDRAYVPKTGSGFMGRDWDKFVPPPAAWDECMRVLKPGGHLLAFSAPRTQDLMGISIRLAGFEIRDGLAWLSGQGYPKSRNVSKAIDEHARGAMVRDKLLHFAQERGIDGRWLESRGIASAASFADWTAGGHVPSERNWQIVKGALEVTDEEETAFERRVLRRGRAKGTRSTIGPVGVSDGEFSITAAATDEAARWEGWGTSLKPSHEPVIFARRPLTGTVAANVLEHGTGAINVSGCLVGSEERVNHAGGASSLQRVSRVEQGYRPTVTDSSNEDSEVTGRWPANVLLGHAEDCDDYACAPGCPVAELDRQSGTLKGGGFPATRNADADHRQAYGEFSGQHGLSARRMEDGGASRFFPVFRYEAKAGTAERPRLADGTAWPTVKPVPLMQWLVRLVTPPGGKVLDLFAGTGTTGEACVIEGFDCILIDKDPQAIALARVRLAKPVQPLMFAVPDPDPAERASRRQSAPVPKPPPVIDGQGSLFDAEAS